MESNEKLPKGSAGGKVTAILFRKQALEKYYKNPNKCLHCGEVIEVKDGHKIREARVKKYCDHSCAASRNNGLKRKLTKQEKKEKWKRCSCACGNKINCKSTRCKDCVNKIKDSRTKGDLFNNRKNWQSARSCIQKEARRIYFSTNKNPKCFCGYTKHIEVCHIKDVSEFPDTALISEINDVSNLIGMCPTHHWEFDNDELEVNINLIIKEEYAMH